MLTITKRMRLWRGVPKTDEDLAKFRAQTRETLNRPYHFEAKPVAKSWQDGSTDPLDSPFKPFSKLVAPVVAPVQSATFGEELTTFNPRRLILPIGIGVLALGALLLWQVFGTLSSYNRIISPTPRTVQVKSSPAPATSVEPANSNVVPSGTQLQPGGPYTGTGGPEPTAVPTSSSNNVAPTGSPTNLTPGPTPATCASGMICSGTAIDGSACTPTNPCQVVYSTSPLVQASQLIQSGSTTTGQPCSITNPCILTH